MAFAAHEDGIDVHVNVLAVHAVNLDVSHAFDAHEVDNRDVAFAQERVFVFAIERANFKELVRCEKVDELVRRCIRDIDVLTGIFGDDVEPFGSGKKAADGHELHGNRVILVALAVEPFKKAAHFIIGDFHRMTMDGSAPVEELVDIRCIMNHRIKCRTAVTNIARQDFLPMRQKIIRRHDGSHSRRHGLDKCILGICTNGFIRCRKSV